VSFPDYWNNIHATEERNEMKTPKAINVAALLQKTRRTHARAGQRFADRSKYTRKIKHKDA